MLECMIYFVLLYIEKLCVKVFGLIYKVDVVFGNLEDVIFVDVKMDVCCGFIELVRQNDFGVIGFWIWVNCFNSFWFFDDFMEIVLVVGDKLDVIMLFKVEGLWDIYYFDQFLVQLEVKLGVKCLIMIYVILEIVEGVKNVEVIVVVSLWMYGMSFGLVDLVVLCGMKIICVGGGYLDYVVLVDQFGDGLCIVYQ